MIELIARKAMTGQVSINKAKIHMSRHEWGLARMAIEDAIDKGGMVDDCELEQLLHEIRMRLWGLPEPAPTEE